MAKQEIEINSKFYVILRTCKEDMKALFEGNRKMLEKIDKFDDEQMNYISHKLAQDYLEQLYWSSLKNIVEEVFEK